MLLGLVEDNKSSDLAHGEQTSRKESPGASASALPISPRVYPRFSRRSAVSTLRPYRESRRHVAAGWSWLASADRRADLASRSGPGIRVSGAGADRGLDPCDAGFARHDRPGRQDRFRRLQGYVYRSVVRGSCPRRLCRQKHGSAPWRPTNRATMLGRSRWLYG
jgi:hypothetical protein